MEKSEVDTKFNGMADMKSLEKEPSSGVDQVVTSEDGEPNSTHVNELHRTFKSRHIQMICLGGCIGSGIFISTGKALREGGAPAMLIGYSLICSMALAVMNVLSEHTCLFPTPGSFIDHSMRFVDPAVAFATGFCEWFGWMTVVASEGAIVRVILTYWTESLPTAAAITIYLAIVFGIHTLPNRWFGEFEFGTAALKVLAMIAILITMMAITGGVGPKGSKNHASNFRDPPAFPNCFKGVCTTFLLAGWATGGQEIMGLSAGEARMPRWDMPRACTNLFARILIFYELAVIFIGVLVPYDDSRLLGTGTVASSPFVIAMNDAGIKVLPDIMNAVILLGLAAIGAESIYNASRFMTAMARLGLAPKILGRIDKKGRPYWALTVTALFSTVCAYINCSSTGGTIFTWFSSISSTVFFIAWMVIAVTNIQIRRAIKAQGDNAWKLPYAWKLRAFPATSVYLFVTSFVVLFLTGYVSLYPIGKGSQTNVVSFFQTFLGVPLWIVCYLGYKIVYRTKFADPATADLKTGRWYLSDEDVAFLDHYHAQPWWKRALSYVGF